MYKALLGLHCSGHQTASSVSAHFCSMAGVVLKVCETGYRDEVNVFSDNCIPCYISLKIDLKYIYVSLKLLLFYLYFKLIPQRSFPNA